MNTSVNSPSLCSAAEEAKPGQSSVVSGHIPALDGLRGIAVLLVMMFHYCSPLYEQGTVFSKIAYKLTHFGWCGVDLFFVLSGFLITGILYDSKDSRHYFRTFYIRRTLRIFPLYYGVLAFYFLLIPAFWSYKSPADAAVLGHQWPLWLYYTNIDTALHGWTQNGDNVNMSHFWSLAVEEQFYVIWPAVVLICNRRMLMGVCIACIVGALILRVWLTYGMADILAPYVLTPCRMDALAWGALVALAARGPGGIIAMVKPAKRILLIASLALILIIARLWYFSPAQPLVITFGFSAIAALFAGLLVLAVFSSDRSVFGRVCRNRVLRAIGKIAYGLYIYHYLIHPFVTQILPFASRYMPYSLAALVYLVGAFAAAFAISLLSWHLFEKHFLRLKDWLAPTNAGIPRAATAPVPTESSRVS